MKRFIGTLIVTLMTTSSQASTNLENGRHYVVSNRYVTQPQIATRSAQGRVKFPKPKLFVSNPHKVTDDDDDVFEIDNLITSYRRRDLTKVEHPEGISEKVRWRLFLARQLAMMKYRSLHTIG